MPYPKDKGITVHWSFGNCLPFDKE